MSELLYDVMRRSENTILEMVTETTLTNVPIHPSIQIDEITADDPNPRFVNVEVIRSDAISGNGRRYNGSVVRQINNMIPGLQGFLGHPDPTKYGFEFREPQCIFVGSLIEEMGDNVIRSIAKAYLFKSSNLREWIPKSIAANNPMTVSINGQGDVIYGSEFVDVVSINKLDSIDWANPGTEGIDTSKAMSVVREMENNNNGGNDNMDVKEILKNTTVTEIKAFNPDVYSGMIRSVTMTELCAANPTLAEEIKNSARVTEMTVKIDGAEKSVKFTEIQGIIDTLNGKITELENDKKSGALKVFKAEKLAAMVPEDLREQVSKRIIGDTEEAITASINAELTYIRELTGMKNIPVGSNHRTPAAGDTIYDDVASLFGVQTAKDKK